AIPLWCAAQSPQVPHKMTFAGMTLTIRDDARKEIQADVDALTRSPRHFNIKVERAKTYFPIIEKIFAEENLPDDFKYLVLQESALIPDAVSVSKAVGFWQFKDFTAEEMGLRVDRHVDERMNIVSSTRAAARYIKKNNYYFNNWLYALQAYQMGAGGAMKAVGEGKPGAKHMDITSKTYWYVKKFLAHKIAFEGAVAGPGEVTVAAFPSSGHRSLKEIARAASISEEELLTYNKWVRNGNIPDDKAYTVLVPVNASTQEFLASVQADIPRSTAVAAIKPPVETASREPEPKGISAINGVPVIAARQGETAAALAKRAGISLTKFLRYNDLSKGQRLIAGEYYFTAKKRNRGQEDYHKVSAGETLWAVSQRHGIRLSSLLRFNRMDRDDKLSEGTMLYLTSRRPADDRHVEEVVEVDQGSVFAWSVDPVETSSTVQGRVQSAPVSRTEEPAARYVPERTESEPSASASKENESNRVIVIPEPEKEFVSETRPADKTPVTSGSDKHEVLPGETLYAISRQYQVSVSDLVRWNNLDVNTALKPGQVLVVKGEPAAAERTVSASSPIIHEVRPSDTLYSVARKYGVSIRELMEWNGKSDFNISVGEKLKVHPR
ncbi:MAG: LysM peptidoglycan-binding domain-containing protein, partial [Bacteroidota bacterium]